MKELHQDFSSLFVVVTHILQRAVWLKLVSPAIYLAKVLQSEYMWVSYLQDPSCVKGFPYCHIPLDISVIFVGLGRRPNAGAHTAILPFNILLDLLVHIGLPKREQGLRAGPCLNHLGTSRADPCLMCSRCSNVFLQRNLMFFQKQHFT